jgi:hypothetical protein
MRNRRRQNEKAGCFTDEDGYKRARNDRSTWQSGRSAGILHPPESHQPTLARFNEYPCQQELALVSRAIEQRWRVSEAMKTAILGRLQGILEDGNAFDRDVINAARAIVSMEKQNQDDVLKTRAQEASLLIRLLDQRNRGASAPDPDFIAWKQQRAIEAQANLAGVDAERAPSAPPAGPGAGERPVAPAPGDGPNRTETGPVRAETGPVRAAPAPGEPSGATGAADETAPLGAVRPAPLKRLVDQRRRAVGGAMTVPTD